jgi:signal peptidase II
MRLWGPFAPLGLALAALVFGLDQTHKWWMLSVYAIEARQPVALTSFFDLVLAWNRGISYGLLKTDLQGLLIVVSLALSAMLWAWLARSRSALNAAALALVLGGALSTPSTGPSMARSPISSISIGKFQLVYFQSCRCGDRCRSGALAL